MTCASLSCNNQCHEPDSCIAGCSCPPGQVENEDRQCVTVDKCVCYDKDKVILPGQIIEKDCESW